MSLQPRRRKATRRATHGATCLSDGERGWGWLYCQPKGTNDDSASLPVTNLTLILPDMRPGRLDVEFWDTARGMPLATVTTQAVDATLAVEVPPFVRDTAFKLKPQKHP